MVAGVSMEEVFVLRGRRTAITRRVALARSIERTPERTSFGRGRWTLDLRVRQTKPSLMPMARTAEKTIARARNPPKSSRHAPATTTNGHQAAQLDKVAITTSTMGFFGELLRVMKRL